jgi:hypothetical protein
LLAAYACFILITGWPVLRRMSRPTILTDDIIRLVNLVEHPLRELLFRPFNEHIAFLFEFVSWFTWQMVGHDLRLAPLGFTIASVLPWIAVLVLFGHWLFRETGSRTASLVAVAVAAQSPLAMDTAWWYSASSFSWAIAGILLALLGASEVRSRPWRATALVFLGTMLAPAGTSLGHLAMPLAALRGLVDSRISYQRKLLVILAAAGGATGYFGATYLGSSGAILARLDRRPYIDPRAGLNYAMSVPGRVLLPSLAGLPATWCVNTLPLWLGWLTAVILLISLTCLALWPRAPWRRRTVILGAAMIYLGYGLIYSARACMVTQFGWTEAQLIYLYAARYHVLPLLGSTTVLAALVAAWGPVRRSDRRLAAPAIIGSVVGLVALCAQFGEARNAYLTFLLNQPDQRATLAALHDLGRVARKHGITRDQLLRIIAPAMRPWNQSVMTDCPAAFPMMKLVDAPRNVSHPLSDDDARGVLLRRLTEADRLALGMGACASMIPPNETRVSETLSIARPWKLDRVRRRGSGLFQSEQAPGLMVFEFEPTSKARFLVLPGLRADQELDINCRDVQGRWRPARFFRWMPSSRSGHDAVIDLARLIQQWDEPVTQVAVQFTQPGEIALDGPPRLMR